jgi:hypothetical protein
MRELVFLLEEESAKVMLEGLLPRILSPQIAHRLIPFEGKRDLEKQMMKRMRGYLNPKARFIVMRDQDSHPDCKALKASLFQKCQGSGKESATLVRILCHELETIYLADLAAVELGLNIQGLVAHQQRVKFRNPDNQSSPSHELKTLTKMRYDKVGGSRRIGPYLDLNNERSASFRNLVEGVRRMEHELLQLT